MGILNKLIFDNVDSSDFGVYISGEGTYNAPERRGQKVQIPGRNGDLILDEGSYENIPVEYRAFIGTKHKSEFDAKIEAFRAELVSRGTYKRLTDTYHPDEFRLGAYREGLEVEPTMHNRAGGFTMVFDCKPQRFLVSGETPQTFTASGSITNPTLFASSPMLEVVGTGTVTIGSYSFTINSNPGRIYIDSDIMEAWSVSGSSKVSQNGSIVYANHKTPKIEPGTVSITLGAGISELKITPRWWRL